MATPAVPPANMIAPIDKGGAAAFSPVPGTIGAAGDNFFLRSSYVAKYLPVSSDHPGVENQVQVQIDLVMQKRARGTG